MRIDLDRLRARPPVDEPDAAPAAVASIVRDGELLLIRRADRRGDPWSGHVAFPGGKREPSDASLVDTAVRETREEVGLALPPPVTRLDDVIARTTTYRVAQFVFVLDGPEPPLAPNAEVAATLWVPLERLASGDGAGTFPWVHDEVTYELPCIRLGEHVLWGMTLRMVGQLLVALRA